MGDLKFPALVMEHCLCEGCKPKFNELKKEIPQVHSIEFDTEQLKVTIFGAVDPAEVMEKLERKKLKAKILWKESSPINNHHHHQQKQIVSPEPSAPKIHEQVQVPPDDLAVVHFGDFPSETAGIRIPKMQQQKKQHLDLVPHRHQSADAAAILVSEKSISKHEHKLELKMFNKQFACDGCKEYGFKSRYRCEGCDFELHEECNSRKSTIVPDLLGRYTFEFCPKPPPADDPRFCDGCGGNIYGFFYHCKAKRLNLHPCCAKLKAQVPIQETIFQLREKVSKNCMWCKNADPKVGGWSYVSECENYNFHIHCLTGKLHQAWQKGPMSMDDASSLALEAIDSQRMAIPKGKGGGKKTAMKWLKIIGIFIRTIVGILFGDPTALMIEVGKQLLPIESL